MAGHATASRRTGAGGCDIESTSIRSSRHRTSSRKAKWPMSMTPCRLTRRLNYRLIGPANTQQLSHSILADIGETSSPARTRHRAAVGLDLTELTCSEFHGDRCVQILHTENDRLEQNRIYTHRSRSENALPERPVLLHGAKVWVR